MLLAVAASAQHPPAPPPTYSPALPAAGLPPGHQQPLRRARRHWRPLPACCNHSTRPIANQNTMSGQVKSHMVVLQQLPLQWHPICISCTALRHTT